MDTFDLEGYLRTSEGFFPSQYWAAVGTLVIGLAVGILSAILLRRYQNRKGSGLLPIFVLPIAIFGVAASGFFIFDNNVREHHYYTYDYYDPSVNADLRDWAQDEYGVKLTKSEASALKFRETPGIFGFGEVVHPTGKVPGVAGSVKITSEVKDDNVSLRYVAAGETKSVPINATK